MCYCSYLFLIVKSSALKSETNLKSLDFAHVYHNYKIQILLN